MTSGSYLTATRRRERQNKSSINPIIRYWCLKFTLMSASHRGGDSAIKQTWIGFTTFFADEHHNLNITKKLGEENTRSHSKNAVIPNGKIASALDNLAMYSTAYQSHVENLMKTIRQLMYTNKILRNQIKQLAETNSFLARQGKEDKKATRNDDSYLTKLDPAGYFWNHGWRVIQGHSSRS